MDYKLLTAVLASRLNEAIAPLVGALQPGFLAGRFIVDNVILIRDYLAWVREHRQQRGLIFLDFQKAYDRVRWNWLWKVMAHIGLEGRILLLTQACYYSNPQVRLLLEGISMGLLHPTRGVRQGCPLSPLLFALSIEPLHHRLSRDPALTGVVLPRRDDGSRPPQPSSTRFALR